MCSTGASLKGLCVATPTPSRARHAVWRTLAVLLVSLMATAAQAAQHALVLWIGQYADPRIHLVGVEQDASLARGMALALGVPAANIIERSNGQLTHAGLRQALAELAQRLHDGDSAMIYFSGHGRQLPHIGGKPGCSEGLATYEGGVYFDQLLRDQLDALAEHASRVVMFNDSCFSGGAATKQATAPAPKLYPSWAADAQPQSRSQWVAKSSLNLDADGSAPRSCGTAVNYVGKAMSALALQAAQARVVYIAGAAANEAAYPTAQGSVATRAWAACLTQPTAGPGRSMSGSELTRCAQTWVERNSSFKQTITLVGNGELPLRP